MDGVAVTLQPAEEAKGEDADKQANQRQQDPHPCDDVQEQVVHAVCFLWEVQEKRETCLSGLFNSHLQLLYLALFSLGLLKTYMSHTVVT